MVDLGWRGQVQKENRNAPASPHKTGKLQARTTIFKAFVSLDKSLPSSRAREGVPGYFTVLLNLLNLGLETGSLFGPLYLCGPLAIYLEAQSAVCNITSCCRGDGDV